MHNIQPQIRYEKDGTVVSIIAQAVNAEKRVRTDRLKNLGEISVKVWTESKETGNRYSAGFFLTKEEMEGKDSTEIEELFEAEISKCKSTVLMKVEDE